METTKEQLEKRILLYKDTLLKLQERGNGNLLKVLIERKIEALEVELASL